MSTYKKIVSALTLTLLMAGCSAIEQDPTSAAENMDAAEVGPTASIQIFVSDEYLDEQRLTASEFFNVGASECDKEEFVQGSYSGHTFTKGYESVDELADLFDFSGTHIPDVLSTSCNTEDGVLTVDGSFTNGLADNSIIIYVDMEFPEMVADYGGDAVRGYSISEGDTISMEIHNPGIFNIAGK